MAGRLAGIVVLCCVVVTPLTAQGPIDTSQTGSHVSRASKRLFGKQALIRVGASVVFAHVINAPKEWGRGFSGLGKRAGSGIGNHLVKGSIQYAVGTIRHEEFGYRRSDKVGFKPRLTYALLSTVITRDTRSGNRKMSAGRISGTVGAGLISRLWNPVRLHTFASGFSSAGISMGIDAGSNVVREFWPEIRRRKSKPLPAEALVK